MLYYPNSYRYVDEKDLDYPPTEVELTADGQTDLLNWYFEAKSQTRKPLTIIFAHGNGQNISSHFRSLYWVLDRGLNLFIVGYPSYGPNDGEATPSSTVEAVSSAIMWVKNNRPDDSILIYGQSLGGNVALRAVSENNEIPYCGVAIEGSFLSYKKVAQQTMARSWLLWSFQLLPYILISDSKSIGENLKNLPETQYLVIHGKDDQSVSFNLGLELFDHLPESKQFWAIEGGKHIDTFARHPSKRDEFINFVNLNCLSKK
jgi:pimeloyl-ACP methyl ester carboxylesterase